MVDLRSDTVTCPDEGMRRAMYEAEVGDDVFGEDPTINRLEAKVAEDLGKEAAVFVPSGTMGNQLGLLAHTRRGAEVILERGCHIFNHEGGAGAWLSGVQINPLDGRRGILTQADIEPHMRTGQYGEPATCLISLENTHNQAGGVIQPLEVLKEIRALSDERGIPMHLDGARLWNASAASGIAESTYASFFDTVSVCLSKGLGAPVGSVLAGSRDAIAKARFYRKRLGGGMRQAGFLAAAGLYALKHNRKRLTEDHERARALATALNETDWFEVDPKSIESNIVYFKVVNKPASEAVALFEKYGILTIALAHDQIRVVTHLNFTDADLQHTKEVLTRHFS